MTFFKNVLLRKPDSDQKLIDRALKLWDEVYSSTKAEPSKITELEETRLELRRRGYKEKITIEFTGG